MTSLPSSEQCLFTGLPADISFLSDSSCHRFWVNYPDKGEKYDYYIQDRLLQDLTSEFSRKPISLIQKTKIMNKILSLKDDGVIPYFLYDKKVNFNLKMRDEVLIPIEYHQEIKIEIQHKNKEENILNLLAKKLKDHSPFESMQFNTFDLYRLSIVDLNEFRVWLKKLESDDYIAINSESADESNYSNFSDFVCLRPHGWSRVHQLNRSQESKNVFIAMAFTKSDGKTIFDPQVREAIKKTCKSLGWTPLIVDEHEHNDGIVDKIISLINNAHFVIADLTHHKHGVYYEAGYARAMGIPVIHTVHKTHLKKVHFDLKHINLITWDNLDDLEEKLSNRISATIIIRKKS